MCLSDFIKYFSLKVLIFYILVTEKSAVSVIMVLFKTEIGKRQTYAADFSATTFFKYSLIFTILLILIIITKSHGRNKSINCRNLRGMGRRNDFSIIRKNR